MKVTWSDGHLQVVAGDEIKILRGKGKRESGQILATRIENVTRGTNFKSSVEGVHAMEMPHDFIPPIHGYAKNIEMRKGAVSFILEEKAPPIVGGILRECAKFIDPKLYQRCKDKDYHDVVTNAFPILEDRIRAKIGVDPSYSGQRLIDHAFNPKTGKLILGEIPSEKQALHLLFKGAIGFLRNPPSHRLTEDEGNIEAFEIIFMVDLLLRIVDKAELQQLTPKNRTRDRGMKVAPKLPKELPGAAIEIARNRREHSQKIIDGAVKPWLSNVGEYCKIDAVYSKDSDTMVGVEPKDPTDLKFFEFAKSHLETKYPDVLKAWEELKHVTSKHNKELATFLEEIRTSIIKVLKLRPYYSKMSGRAPDERITLDRFLETIYAEIRLRLINKRKWMVGEPNIKPAPYGDKMFYELEWGTYSNLVRSLDKKKVDKALPLINKLVEMPRFSENVKNLMKIEDQIYKMKCENFEAKIKDVINSVELGNVLKGKCRHCP